MRIAHHVELRQGVWVKLNLTRQTKIEEGVDGDWWTGVSTARLPAGLTRKEAEKVRRQLSAGLSRHCQHSYDCCGHWYRTVNVKIVGRRVQIRFSNYQNI